jgi:hypothetical protein
LPRNRDHRETFQHGGIVVHGKAPFPRTSLDGFKITDFHFVLFLYTIKRDLSQIVLPLYDLDFSRISMNPSTSDSDLHNAALQARRKYGMLQCHDITK